MDQGLDLSFFLVIQLPILRPTDKGSWCVSESPEIKLSETVTILSCRPSYDKTRPEFKTNGCIILQQKENTAKSLLNTRCSNKTRDFFKKIRDTKQTFHAKMGSIKDRNGMDLTEAEEIKKR